MSTQKAQEAQKRRLSFVGTFVHFVPFCGNKI
jgi:hypothetical protein